MGKSTSASRAKMSQKRAPRTVPKVDADQLYDRLLSNLNVSISVADKENAKLLEAASQLVDSLQGTEGGGTAHQALQDLKARIHTLKSKQAEMLRESSKKAAGIMDALLLEARAKESAERNRERKRAIREEYDRRIQEARAAAEAKTQELTEDYLKSSSALHESLLQEVKGIRKSTVSEHLDKINEALETLDAEERAAKERGEEKRKKAEGPKKTRQQIIEEELRDLRKGLFRRYAVDPLINKAVTSIKDTIQTTKDRTGITAVTKFLTGEKERRERLRELQDEYDRLRTVTSTREALVGQQAVLQAALSGTAAANRDSRALSDAIDASAISLRHSVRAIEELREQNVETVSLFSRVFGKRKEKDNSYDRIAERALAQRQTKALEDLASGKFKKKSGLSFGWGDLALLATTLAGAIGSYLGNLNIPNVLSGLTTGLAALRAGSATMLAKFVTGLSETSKYLKDLVTGKLGDLKDWMKTDGLKRLDEALDILKEWKEGLLGKAQKAVSSLTATGKGLVNSGVAKAGAMVSRGASAVSGTMGTVMEAAKPAAEAVSNYAGKAAMGAASVGKSAVALAGKAGGVVADYASRGMASLSSAAKSIASTPAGQFMGRNLNRLGNLGAVVGTVTGIAEEATGTRVNSLSVMDAVLNPMNAGRYLGNKFNKTFESRMGQSFGSWVYDKLNDDPAVTELRGLRTAVSPESQRSDPMRGFRRPTPETRMVRESVPDEKPAQTSTTAQPASTGPRFMPKANTVSAVPNLSVSSIPDSAGFDVGLQAMNVYAL